MRFPLALLLTVFLASSAEAAPLDEWCAQVKAPSSIALCSDPELRTLAVERQQVFNATRGRIGEARYPELAADQSAWVTSYPKACGVAQDVAPSLPLAASVRSCMANAGRARIAYLAAYGLRPVSGSSPAPRVGPSFDCGTASTPLARLICGNAELSKTDLRLNQAFYALRFGLDPSGRSALDAEDRDFVNEVILACGIPESSTADGGSSDCIAEWYGRKRSQWMARLSGTAREEASRSLEQCIALQAALQRLQFLPSSASIDGVYGGVTRTAILGWQQANNRQATGIVGDADAAALLQGTPPPPQMAALQPAAPTEGQSTPVAPIVTQGGRVQLRERGGVYRLPVRINDTITLDFTLDSGAADVQIPADVVLTLIRSETLTPRDFQGERIYEQADGTRSPSQRFILRELRVGDHRLTNVAASVGDTKGGLLLGQSFLSRFKSWTLDNEQHVVTLTER
jgi:uncharacterized protein